MAQKQTNVKIDFAGGVFLLGVFVLIILFWGEPDLHDAIIHRLMGPAAPPVEADAPQ